MSEGKNARDTQFMGFAKALVTEIINEVPATIYPLEIDISDKLLKLLARRAYDFACHAVSHVSESQAARMEVSFMSAEEVVNDIPDLTELPKEQDELTADN